MAGMNRFCARCSRVHQREPGFVVRTVQAQQNLVESRILVQKRGFVWLALSADYASSWISVSMAAASV